MKKILVIEDNDSVREEIALILGFENFEVAVATNGRMGLESIHTGRPDLILCDLMMPEMDGYATLAALRSDPDLATIPFVYLTARAERDDMRRAMELGADDYVTKPFTADELLAAVRAALEKKGRAERETEGRVATLREQHSARIRRLCELATDPSTSPREQIAGALRMGCECFGLDAGIVSRIEGDVLIVEQTYYKMGNPPPQAYPETILSYSRLAWTARCPVSFHDLSESPHLIDASHHLMPMQSYLGLPFMVDRSLFGTLDFVGVSPKPNPFAADDLDLLRLLAHWIEAVVTRKQAADALAEAHDRAVEATRLKSEFLANMSHEIRTPMNAIIGMTDLALDTALDAEQRTFLDVVKSAAGDLLTLLNDLLDFSKIEAGRLNLEPVPTALRKHIADLIRPLAPQAQRKGLELLCQIAPEVPEVVSIDPVRLRQVLVNLITNAIKFTEEGEIVLRVTTESRAHDRAILRFSLTDTGIGIPPEKQERIFVAFAQADGSMTRKYGGTGLGLAVSAQLVEMMKGRLWVDSDVSRGSTFHFTVAVRLGDGTPASKTILDRGTLDGAAVLIVDDNETNRTILTQMLRAWGTDPFAVAGGREALATLRGAVERGTPFSLAIIDGQMPEMDGFALAARIREEHGLPPLALVMLTSSDRSGELARCKALGVDAYLTKPIVEPAELLGVLQDAIGGRNAKSQTEPASPKTGASACDGTPLRVLVAEDDLANRILVTRLLEKRGYSVVAVKNGRQAVNAAQGESFDLVIMDVQMPELDGCEATRAIRERERATNVRVPIMGLTAHALKADVERCLDAGMDAHLAKPMKAAALFETIEKVQAAAARKLTQLRQGVTAERATIGSHPAADKDG